MRLFIFIVSAVSGYVQFYILTNKAKRTINLVSSSFSNAAALSMYPIPELGEYAYGNIFICHMCFYVHIFYFVNKNVSNDQMRW